MPAASGLGAQMGLAKETTYGTPVTVSKFYEFDSESFALDQTFQDSVGIRANRTVMPSGRMRQTTRQAGGGIPMDVPTKGFGAILDLMHGLVPTVVQQAATAAYLQTHLVGTSQPNKSATIQFNRPTSAAVDTAFTYPGSVLTGITFNLDVAGILKCTTTWDALDERTTTTTPAGAALATASYPTGVTSWIGTGSVGTATVNIGASPVAVVKSLTFGWTQPYKEDRFYIGGGGLKAKPIPNGFAAMTGTAQLEWIDSTAYTQFRTGTPITFSGQFQNAIIASTYYEQFGFNFSAAQPRSGSPNVDGFDVLDQPINFVMGDDGTNTPLILTYQSTDVTI